MVKQLDLFEMLGISANEDVFTNLMKYLFDNEKDFRDNFTRKFLSRDEPVNSEDSILLTRTTYIPESNKRIIPDLVLYSKELNRIAVIEVKIHSGQGYNQLKRYKDNVEIIKGGVGLKADAAETYYYLSIEDDIGKANKEWNLVNWKDMYEVFEVSTSKSDVNYLIEGVKSRIKSLNSKSDFEEVTDQSFNDHLRWNLWKSPGKRLKEIISSNPSYAERLSGFDSQEYGTYFAPAVNTVETTLILSKDGWKSELECTDKNSNLNNCYDFHVEIRISTDNEKSYMDIRLDHHLNPYAPNKVMKKILGETQYNSFSTGKQEFLKEMKFNKYVNLGQDRGYRYNRATGYYLWIIKKSAVIENKDTVEEVLDCMMEEIEFLLDKIELFKNEVINFKLD